VVQIFAAAKMKFHLYK